MRCWVFTFWLIVFLAKKQQTKELSFREYICHRIAPHNSITFVSSEQSLLVCILRCSGSPNCTSVFYSTSLCQGSSIVYSPLSSDLMPLDGARYYIKEGTTNFTLQDGLHGPSRSGFCVLEERKEHCNTLNYTWDDGLNICFRYHPEGQKAKDCKDICQLEDLNSRVLLVNSDQMFHFAVRIIAAHRSASIYLQGTRSGDVFLDDFGREITYFKWGYGEPGTGNYIRTDSDTNLQKTSGGSGIKQFICRVY